jgi:hypothetical protein
VDKVWEVISPAEKPNDSLQTVSGDLSLQLLTELPFTTDQDASIGQVRCMSPYRFNQIAMTFNWVQPTRNTERKILIAKAKSRPHCCTVTKL